MVVVGRGMRDGMKGGWLGTRRRGGVGMKTTGSTEGGLRFHLKAGDAEVA